VLDLDGLWTGSLPKLQELASAVDRFRESGKPAVAFAGGYSQEQYLVAAHADEVLLEATLCEAIRPLLPAERVEARGEVALRGKAEAVRVYSVRL